MKIGVILYVLIKFAVIQIVVSDISHLLHHGIFQHQYQPFYEGPQYIKPIQGSPPSTISTTTEFLLPEIIINKRTKNDKGYEYDRPSRPPHNTYIPPSSDSQFIPIDNPILQFPYDDKLPEIPNESFPISSSSTESDENTSTPSQGYIPPINQENQRFKKFGGNIVITYDKNEVGRYDYNVPTKKPSPILIPTPAVGADSPITTVSSISDEAPIQGYNYEVPVSQDVSPSTPLPNPENNPSNIYLPPVPSDISIRHAKDFAQFNANAKNPIKLQLKEMRCLNNQGGYFKAILRLDSLIGLVPIVDNDILDTRCDLKLVQSYIIVNIGAEDFSRCGIRQCSENLCLRMRFPLIHGMKTGSDSLLTLQCKIQEKVVAKTHALKMGIANDIQSKGIGVLAQGGNQQLFRTHINILRKSANGFTRNLEPHGSVQLGEELLLRAHVNAGDGWNYTKLTDINLRRISSSGDLLNSANLITSYGCINPTMRLICPVQPSFDPPLGHRLSFKAIIFQGMHSGEEIIMSMKITGCIERADCYVNTQYCDGPYGRLKRSLNQGKIRRDNSTEFEEISTISFRVIIPPGDSDGEFSKKSKEQVKGKNKFNQRQMLLLISGGIGSICFISIFAVVIYIKLK